MRPTPRSKLFPYTTLFRSLPAFADERVVVAVADFEVPAGKELSPLGKGLAQMLITDLSVSEDRKSTRLNSSHSQISYAVFCLKKKNATCSVYNLCTARTVE